MRIILKPWIVAAILLRLLGPILTNYSILSQFPDFHHFSIFLHSDVIIQQWLERHATSTLYPPYHLSCHVMATFDFLLTFTKFNQPACPWLFLCHHWTPFNINDNHIPYYQHVIRDYEFIWHKYINLVKSKHNIAILCLVTKRWRPLELQTCNSMENEKCDFFDKIL